MNVIQDFRNELLKRREVKLIIEAGSNPGFDEAGKLVKEKFGASDEQVVVRNVKSKFGRKTFLLDAFIYDSAEDRERIEQKPKVKKEAGK